MRELLEKIINLTDGHPVDAARRDRINELARTTLAALSERPGEGECGALRELLMAYIEADERVQGWMASMLGVDPETGECEGHSNVGAALSIKDRLAKAKACLAALDAPPRPAPTGGEVAGIRARHEREAAENVVVFHPAYPDPVYRDRATLLTALTAAQAERADLIEAANLAQSATEEAGRLANALAAAQAAQREAEGERDALLRHAVHEVGPWPCPKCRLDVTGGSPPHVSP